MSTEILDHKRASFCQIHTWLRAGRLDLHPDHTLALERTASAERHPLYMPPAGSSRERSAATSASGRDSGAVPDLPVQLSALPSAEPPEWLAVRSAVADNCVRSVIELRAEMELAYHDAFRHEVRQPRATLSWPLSAPRAP